MDFSGGSDGKESVCNTEDIKDLGLISGLERSPGEWNGYALQNSCLENSMDRGAWRAPVHGTTKSQTRLSDRHCHLCVYVNPKLLIYPPGPPPPFLSGNHKFLFYCL